MTGAHQVTIRADVSLEQIRPEEAECLIFPGGMPGAQHLSECEKLMTILQHHYDQERTVAAICAAPALVLSHLKTNRKLRVTCYLDLKNIYLISSRGRWSSRRWKNDYRKGTRICYPIRISHSRTAPFGQVAGEVAAGMLLV